MLGTAIGHPDPMASTPAGPATTPTPPKGAQRTVGLALLVVPAVVLVALVSPPLWTVALLAAAAAAVFVVVPHTRTETDHEAHRRWRRGRRAPAA